MSVEGKGLSKLSRQGFCCLLDGRGGVELRHFKG